MTLPDNDMVNSVDGPLRPEPWGLFFFITIIIFSRFLQYEALWTGPTAAVYSHEFRYWDWGEKAQTVKFYYSFL